MCNGKLTLSYGGPGKLKLGYGLPDHGKLNLGYGSRGKLVLSYGRHPQTETQPEHGKLNLGYGPLGKLNLSYGRQTPLPEHGKLNLAYSSRGKLNLSYGSQPQTATPPTPPKVGKLNLGYDGKLQLAYQPPGAVQGKLHLGYAAPGKLQLGYSAKEGRTESCASKALLDKSQAAMSNAPAPAEIAPAVNEPVKTLPAVRCEPAKTPAAVQEITYDVSKLALSGDGSVENVGIKLDAPFQCPDCRQRFVTKPALDIHWRFIHDPNRHQGDD